MPYGPSPGIYTHTWRSLQVVAGHRAVSGLRAEVHVRILDGPVAHAAVVRPLPVVKRGRGRGHRREQQRHRKRTSRDQHCCRDTERRAGARRRHRDSQPSKPPPPLLHYCTIAQVVHRRAVGERGCDGRIFFFFRFGLMNFRCRRKAHVVTLYEL